MKTSGPVSRLVWCGIAVLLLCATRVTTAADSVDSAETMYQRGKAYVKAGNFKVGLKTFRTMQKDHPRSRRAVRGWEYIAVCENQLNNQFAAFEAYQKIWDDHKDFSRLSVITRNQMKIGNHYLKYKQYPTAVEIFTQILRNAPYSEVAPAAQYSLAQAYIGKKDYGAAKIEFGKVIQNYPASQLVDDSAFAIGYVDYVQSEEKDYDQTATANAIASFRQFIHDFPSSPKVEKARVYITSLRDRKAASMYRTAQFYENVRANKAAEIMYREVIEQYPDSTLADESRTRLTVLKEGPGGPAIQSQNEQKLAVLAKDKEIAVAHEESKRSKAGSEIKIDRSIKTPVFANTAETTVRTTPSTTVPVVPATIEVAHKQRISDGSARKLKKILNDPKLKQELKEYLKKPYTEERKRSRKVRAEWQAQKVAMLSRAKSDADAYLGKTAEASVAVAPERTELLVKRTTKQETVTTPNPGEWEPVKDLKVSGTTEVSTPILDTKTEVSLDTEPVRNVVSGARELVETAIDQNAVVQVEYSDDEERKSEEAEATFVAVDSETAWEALRSETDIEKEATTTETIDTATQKTAVYTAESTDSYSVDDDTLVIDLSDPEPPAKPATVERTASLSVLVDRGVQAEVSKRNIPEGAEELKITETVEEWQPAAEESTSLLNREPERAVETGVAVETRLAAAGLNIRAETTVTPPPVHDSEKAAFIAAEKLKEQQRAREARQGIGAIRKERDDSVWQKRNIPAQGNVRTAKYNDEMKKELKSEYDIDVLKQDYAGIFYIIQQGDASRQRGMFGTAKQRYGAALDRLLALKKKAPTWESDIINFRIKYCRDYMRKLD